MAVIAVQPYIMGQAKLTLGANDYEGHVSSAMYTPADNAPVPFKGLAGNTFTFAKLATWTLDLEYAQDFETVNSLALYLLANEGTTVTAVFEPVDGGQGYTSEVTITPGAIGGAVDTVATATVSLGSTKPEPTV